ncbi:hypothetical protein [Bradyrhizobium sp. URHC0002]
MKVTARGWSRNMGAWILAEYDLKEYIPSSDPNQYLRYEGSAVFKLHDGIGIHWHKKLKLTGDYRIEVNFTKEDVAELFQNAIGRELTPEIIEKYDFIIAPELKKKMLGEIKLADLTIGDLASIAVAPEKKEEAPPAPKPFIRRI